MPVRGSINYVWFTEQLLGSGAMGSVYFGRHKRTGDACAIKVFVEQVRQVQLQAREKELEWMKKLNHKNIVKFIVIEEETRTKEKVLVMEMCSEGSVQDLIAKPENAYGFPESEFFILFSDLMTALEYLRNQKIIHRDIKPGNILCCKDEDGRTTYKLTDFGSARELPEGDNFTSMHGTEEYLHPDVYGVALMQKPRSSNQPGGFNIAVDLWSIGATLYHIATGQLPFQPYGGRSNQETMFKILSNKQSGKISGIQKEKMGPIFWSEDFPATCPMSQGLKDHIVPIISGVMEKNPTRQLTFEQILARCNQIRSFKIVYIYSAVTLTQFILYLPEQSTLNDLQEMLHRQSDISVENQILISWENKLIRELLSSRDTLNKFPDTSLDQPALLWTRVEGLRNRKPDPMIIPDMPVYVTESGNLVGDAKWSHDVCAVIIYCRKYLRNLLKGQQMLATVKQVLSSIKQMEFTGLHNAFKEYRNKFASIQLSVNLCNLNANDVLIPLDEQNMVEKLGRLEKHIVYLLSHFNSESLRSNDQLINDGCETSRCEIKMSSFVDQSDATYEQFHKDKGRTLSYNEEQIHKYDKIKLNEVLKKALMLLNDHCIGYTNELYQKMVEWSSKQDKDMTNHLEHLKKDLEKFSTKVEAVAQKIEKIDLASIQSSERHEESGIGSVVLEASVGGACGGDLDTARSIPSGRHLSFLETLNLHLIHTVQNQNNFMINDIQKELEEMDSIMRILEGSR